MAETTQEQKLAPHGLIVGKGTFSCRCGVSLALERWDIQNGMNWYISHLESECLRLMAQQEWVKVEDRKPEKDGEGMKTTDKQRLDWLEKKEADLVCHREKCSDGYTIWWNVLKRCRSISGHPFGSPRAAIDAARFADKQED